VKTVAELYAAFDRAGFLVPAVWTAQPGGTPVPGAVRYFAPGTEPLGDGTVVVTEPRVQFPANQFCNLRGGDRLELELQENVATVFRVRESMPIGSGGEIRATLVAWG
jgi:hypothetical protein